MQRSTNDQISNYELKKRVGTGTYGKVFKAMRKSDGKVVAVKIVDITKMDRSGIESVLNEVRILSSISNPYIVEYYEAFIDPNETTFWIIMEYLGGGDLANAIKISQRDNIKINERQIWSYMIQILKGIYDLHKLKIVHRDIKPANIFLTEDYKRVKIGDMNVSKVLKQDLTKTQIGTPYYLAPEIWNKKSYDYRADVFSLGALVYELAALKHPYEARNTSELHKKILTESIPRLPNYYSEDLNYIVTKCLTKDPSKRPTVEMLLNSRTIQKKIKELDFESILIETEDPGSLLETIIAPKKLSMLNKKLPKRGMGRSHSVKSYDSNRNILNEDFKNDSLRINKIHTPVIKNMTPRLSISGRKSSRDVINRNNSRDILNRKDSKDQLPRPSSRNIPIPRPSPLLKPVKSEKVYERLSVEKRQEISNNNILSKKNSVSNINKRPPLPPNAKLPNNPPILKNFQSERPSNPKIMANDKNNPPMKMPRNNSGLFAKKYISHKVDETKCEQDIPRASSRESKGGTPQVRYQSPRALKYADYINKVVEKEVQPKIVVKAPSIKRSDSARRNFVF